ncbi:MAG: hypothetical protein QG608_526 [Actinomycetota bacterium]|nr:hypothetical protein [Actinomycetota bacterium]
MAGSVLLADAASSTGSLQVLGACVLVLAAALLAVRVRQVRRTRRQPIPLEGLLGPVLAAGAGSPPRKIPTTSPTVPSPTVPPVPEPMAAESMVPETSVRERVPESSVRGSSRPKLVSDLLRAGVVWPDSGPFAAGATRTSPVDTRTPGRATEGQRQVLLKARRELADRRDRRGIAGIAARRAREVSDAGYASLVVRSVEGPRVLWQEPGGTGARQIWGPQTLGALLRLSEPLCEVLGSDPLSADGPTALLAVPVPAGGALVGTLLVRRRAERPFAPSDRDAVSRLARMTGAALDRHARRGDVHREADVDAVTDLPRHSRLLQDLRRALTGAEQHGMPLTLVVLRLPGLRRLGAQQGGAEADRVLKDVVRHLYSALRVGDVLYRFGREELAVLLPGTDSWAAQAVAERISAEVAARVPPDGGARGPEDGGVDPRGRADRPPVPVIVRPVTGVAEDVLGAAVRGLWEADGG